MVCYAKLANYILRSKKKAKKIRERKGNTIRKDFSRYSKTEMVLSRDFANASLLAANLGAGGVLLPKTQKMRSDQMYTDNQFVTSRDF